MKIALLGYGTVGAGVDELIQNSRDLQKDLQITGIFSRTFRPAMGDRHLPSFEDVLQGISIPSRSSSAACIPLTNTSRRRCRPAKTS